MLQHKIFITLAAITLLTGSLTSLTSCQSGEKSSPELAESGSAAPADSAKKNPDGPVEVTLTPAQYKVAAIVLGQVSYRSLNTNLKVNGMFDVPAQNMVSVSVPVGGYIRKIQLEPGMAIRKGQPLVILENPEYIQLQQDYLDTKAKLGYADLEFARQQELSRENVNALKVFQQVKANRQSLQAQLAGLHQRLVMIHIDPTNLTPDRLTRTISIPSPVSGFVTDVPVNNGRFVNPSDVLVQLTDISHMHVRLNIFEKDITHIHTGQKIRFALGDETSSQSNAFPHRGDIFLIGKSIANDRTIAVLAHPDDYSKDYIPGGYISAQIAINTQQLPTLPEAAVVRFGGKTYIYILDRKPTGNQEEAANYLFRQVEVQTGIREGGFVAVTIPDGVDPAKTPIVVGGAYNLLAKLNNAEEE